MEDGNEPGRKRRLAALLFSLLGLLRGGGVAYYATLGLISLGIALTLTLALWYFQSRQPLEQAAGMLKNVPVVGGLPGVSATRIGPPFLFAIYGLEAPLGLAISQDSQ